MRTALQGAASTPEILSGCAIRKYLPGSTSERSKPSRMGISAERIAL